MNGECMFIASSRDSRSENFVREDHEAILGLKKTEAEDMIAKRHVTIGSNKEEEWTGIAE